MTDDALVDEYVAKIKPLLSLAKKAYGSRDTESPQHDASREYTRLLCEFYAKGGKLLKLASALEVTYAGIRRRVTTANLPPAPNRPRTRFSNDEYQTAVVAIRAAKAVDTETYHQELCDWYERGYSLARIAKELGLSSANPLYYGVQRCKMASQT